MVHDLCVGRVAVGTTCGADVHVRHYGPGRGRRVAAEGEGGAVVGKLAVREGAAAAVAEEGGPGAQDPGVGVDGLDGGCAGGGLVYR